MWALWRRALASSGQGYRLSGVVGSPSRCYAVVIMVKRKTLKETACLRKVLTRRVACIGKCHGWHRQGYILNL